MDESTGMISLGMKWAEAAEAKRAKRTISRIVCCRSLMRLNEVELLLTLDQTAINAFGSRLTEILRDCSSLLPLPLSVGHYLT
jgi:hypothetical protein